MGSPLTRIDTRLKDLHEGASCPMEEDAGGGVYRGVISFVAERTDSRGRKCSEGGGSLKSQMRGSHPGTGDSIRKKEVRWRREIPMTFSN